MANVINYAEKWEKELLQIVDDGIYTSPFLAPAEAVKFEGAKTVHFTRLHVGGYKPHSRNGGWNSGDVEEADVPLTIEHDRDIQFLVDKADVDESNMTASVQNISRAFTEESHAPEVDARFFERCAKAAIADGFYQTQTGWTSGNTYSRLVKLFQAKSLKKYKAMGGLIAYVRGDIMDCLESSTEITKTLNIQSVTINEGKGISTRITSINGVTIIEVVDDSRFYADFDYSDGFTGRGARLNVLIAHPLKVKTVNKFASIYTFAPGEHTEGDGYLYQNRALWDTFVFPNGKDGKRDAVFADIESADPSVANYPDKKYTIVMDGTPYDINATGTKVAIEADGTGAVDYIIKLTGKAPKVPAATAQAVYGSSDVKNAAVFMVELGADDAYYGRGGSKVTSGMEALQDSDILVAGDTRYLILAKGLQADGSVYAGAYFSVGTAASTVTKSFKLDVSGLTLA